MALTRFFAVFVLLLSLAVFAAGGGGGNGYGPKPDLQKKPYSSQGKEKASVVFAAANGGGYNGNGPKPDLKKLPYSSQGKEKLFPTITAIQGLVYCKSGRKLIPLEGAVARTTCLAVNEQGYESAPFSILSNAADKKGYFFATMSTSELEENWKLTECKVFLENSPLETCKVPTDVNKGISGALIANSRLLNDKKMKLYSVGPFFYTPEPQSIPNGY